MAVKKSTAAKSSAKAAPKAKAATKAAPKAKAATRAKADTKAAPEAPKAGGAKKAAPKKAPVVKLTDPQRRILGEVAGKKEEGLVGSKANAKQLQALLEKKLIKKGKKQGEFFIYFITKTGEKQATAAAAAPSAEASSSPAS